jgi:hypothetical protein
VANAGDARFILIRNSNPAAGTFCVGPFRWGKQNRGIPMPYVKDGTSNTIFWTESHPQLLGTEVVGQTWNHGIFWSQYGHCPGVTGANGNCAAAMAILPNSSHPNGQLMTAFGDGAVKPLNSNTIDFLLWSYLAGIDDGQAEAGSIN